MTILLRPLAILLSLLLAIMPVMSAQAGMVGNSDLLANSAHQQTRDSLQQLLDRQDAQQQLQALGVSPEWARDRVAHLSDSELARLNQGIDQLEAGGSSVLGVLLIIFIVFIITDAIGATDVFSFVHPVR
ncbi:MAG: PA2779 family protein [Pseudomonadota bacterium]